MTALPEDPSPVPPALRDPRVGLCAACRCARAVRTERSTFYQCRRAWEDPAYAKYPHLPVVACPGFAPQD